MKKEWRMVCKAVVTLTLLLLLLLSMISMRTELGRQTEEKEREPERIEIRNAWVVELTEEEIRGIDLLEQTYLDPEFIKGI